MLPELGRGSMVTSNPACREISASTICVSPRVAACRPGSLRRPASPASVSITTGSMVADFSTHRSTGSSNDPDYRFPFCLSWANENWTRAWDGGASQILMEQAYSREDDRAHIQWLITLMRDDRYITFDGMPVLLVHRASLPAASQRDRPDLA